MTASPDNPGVPLVHFVTLGCPKNEVDTDRMESAVIASGYRVTDNLEDADVAVINTCGFIKAAVEESIDAVLEIADWRDAAPGRRLVTAGCLVSRYGDELADALTESDAFVPVLDEGRIAETVTALIGPSGSVRAESHPGRTAGGPSAYLQVSDGCHRACSYCTIPAIRGPYRSRPLADIVSEAQLLVAHGAREIVLIGQDITAYGHGVDDSDNLTDVVREIARIDGLSWLRLMYLQPDGVTDELIATMASEPTVCHYVDMPLQHVSRQVLRGMRRAGSADRFLETIAKLRAAMPDIALRTTLIAGFPGETDADVVELESFLTDARFDYVGVFPFSPEEGTAAAQLDAALDESVRLARAQRLRDLSDGIGESRAAERVGQTIEVLSEGLDEEGAPVGRWRGQAPEIDGVVLLDTEVPIGRIVYTFVSDAIGYDLIGEVIG